MKYLLFALALTGCGQAPTPRELAGNIPVAVAVPNPIPSPIPSPAPSASPVAAPTHDYRAVLTLQGCSTPASANVHVTLSDSDGFVQNMADIGNTGTDTVELVSALSVQLNARRNSANSNGPCTLEVRLFKDGTYVGVNHLINDGQTWTVDL
jgi:hypothetical protein